MAKDEQAPKDQSEVDANADAAKATGSVRRADLNPEKIDPVTNQKVGDFLTTSDDPDMQKAIDRSNAEIARGNPISRKLLADQMVELSERDKELKEAAEADLAAYEEAKEPDNVQVPLEIWRARENARIKAEAAAKTIDETVPGGKFFEGGRWVDCDGKPVAGPND